MRRLALFLVLVGLCLTPLVLVWYRLPPFDVLPGGRLAQASVILGVGAIITGAVQGALSIPTRPNRQERLSTPRQVAQARQRVLAESRERVTREVRRRDLDDGALVNATWTLGGGSVPTTTALVELVLDDSGRHLLITGAAGHGKTSLALLLAERIMARQGHEGYDGPVPVVVPLARWPWQHLSLTDWLAQHLLDNHNLGNRRAFGETAAQRLVVEGLVLPMMDGADELPAHAQSQLTAYLAAATHSHVVTGRTALPQNKTGRRPDLVTVTLHPLTREAALGYLERSDERWLDVRDEIRGNKRSFVVGVLQSPLMVSLALNVTRSDGGLQRLLATGSSQALRHTLLDRFVPSVFEAGRAGTTSKAERAHERRRAAASWRPEDADRWLRFLARHTTHDSERAIAWWRLWLTLDGSRSYVVAATVLVPLLTLAGVLVLGTSHPWWVAGVTLSMTLGTRAQMASSRLTLTLDAPLGRHPGLDLGFGLSNLLAVVTAVVATTGTGHLWIGLIAGLAALALVQSISMTVNRARDDAPHPGGEALLRTLRSTAVIGAVAHGLAAGLVSVLVMRSLSWSWAYPLVLPFAVGATFVALRMSLWGTYAGVRVTTAVRRQLPWRLARFLADSAAVGVLRETGTAYEFRHEAVRARLATSPAEPGPVTG
jgi:NACHT domain